MSVSVWERVLVCVGTSAPSPVGRLHKHARTFLSLCFSFFLSVSLLLLLSLSLTHTHAQHAGTVLKNLEGGAYTDLERSGDEFYRDVLQTFDNALLYNFEGDLIWEHAAALKALFEEMWAQLLEPWGSGKVVGGVVDPQGLARFTSHICKSIHIRLMYVYVYTRMCTCIRQPLHQGWRDSRAMYIHTRTHAHTHACIHRHMHPGSSDGRVGRKFSSKAGSTLGVWL